MRLLDLASGAVASLPGEHAAAISRAAVHARLAHTGHRGRGGRAGRLGRRAAGRSRSASPATRGRSGRSTSRPTGARCSPRAPTGARSCGTSRATSASTAASPVGRTSRRSTTHRAGSRSARAGARSRSRRSTGRSTCSTPARCAGAPSSGAARQSDVDRLQPQRAAARRDGAGARVTLWDTRTLAPAGELEGCTSAPRRSRSRPTGACSPPPPSNRRRPAAAAACVGRAHPPPDRVPRAEAGRRARVQPGRPAAGGGRRRVGHRDP